MARYRCAWLAASMLVAIGPHAFAQSTAAYTYDALGRVVTTTYPSGSTTTYTYDTADNRTHLTSVVVVNNPPVAEPDNVSTPNNLAVSLNPLSNDHDPDGDQFHITSVGGALNGHGAVTWDGVSTVTFTPTAGYIGPEVIGYWIADSRGGTAQGTIYVTVTAANHPPIASNYSTSAAFNNAATGVDLLSNDSDPDGDAIHVTGVGIASGGTVALNGSIATFTPNAGFSGATYFGYDIADSRGLTAHGTVYVTVNANRAPVANNDAVTTAFNNAVSLNPLSNDTDPDTNPIHITGVGVAAGGTVTLNGSTVTFTPNAGFSGATYFGYDIADSGGLTAHGTVYVTVNANRAPVANNDAATAAHNTAVSLNPLANDSDPDGNPIHITGVGGALGGHGTVSWNGSTLVTFTPTAGFSGSDLIGYDIADSGGLTAHGTIFVTVH